MYVYHCYLFPVSPIFWKLHLKCHNLRAKNNLTNTLYLNFFHSIFFLINRNMLIIGHDTDVQTTPIYCTIIFTECKLIPLFGDINDDLTII